MKVSLPPNRCRQSLTTKALQRTGIVLTFVMMVFTTLCASAQNLNHYDLTLESLGGVHIGERLDLGAGIIDGSELAQEVLLEIGVAE